jgi:exodeoxyribonuclease VII large subunit
MYARPEEARRPLSVSELAQEIRRQLRPLTSVLVKGEVTGVQRTAKRNYSFTIRDAAAAISAFLYGEDARRIGVAPEEGQVFVFRGRVEFWQSGRLALVVDAMQFDDAGRLRAQLEALKRRLESEGAFEASRKRPIPFLPRTVALITSPTGAVIHDLQETILDRYPNMGILVYPAQVQGMASPASLVSALRRCNQEGEADVVVIARGGGSFEELYAFNTEPVARAILASRIPVVTALGHTSDRTVADMVADAECRTPTEAGARVVPRKRDLQAALDERHRRLAREVDRLLQAAQERLEERRRRLVQTAAAQLGRRTERLERLERALSGLSPGRQFDQRRRALVGLGERLEAAARRQLHRRQAELAGRTAANRLQRAVALRVGVAEGRLAERRGRLERASQARLERARTALAHRRHRLEAASPERVLARGYSITTDPSGRVLRSSAETAPGRDVHVRLAAGALEARVQRTHPPAKEER